MLNKKSFLSTKTFAIKSAYSAKRLSLKQKTKFYDEQETLLDQAKEGKLKGVLYEGVVKRKQKGLQKLSSA